MGWSLNSAKYARMGLSGFSFTALDDIMRGFETATNIDDQTTSCIGGYSHGKGGFIAIQATGYGY
jgi:hypothetical protein